MKTIFFILTLMLAYSTLTFAQINMSDDDIKAVLSDIEKAVKNGKDSSRFKLYPQYLEIDDSVTTKSYYVAVMSKPQEQKNIEGIKNILFSHNYKLEDYKTTKGKIITEISFCKIKTTMYYNQSLKKNKWEGSYNYDGFVLPLFSAYSHNVNFATLNLHNDKVKLSIDLWNPKSDQIYFTPLINSNINKRIRFSNYYSNPHKFYKIMPLDKHGLLMFWALSPDNYQEYFAEEHDYKDIKFNYNYSPGYITDTCGIIIKP